MRSIASPESQVFGLGLLDYAACLVDLSPDIPAANKGHFHRIISDLKADPDFFDRENIEDFRNASNSARVALAVSGVPRETVIEVLRELEVGDVRN